MTRRTSGILNKAARGISSRLFDLAYDNARRIGPLRRRIDQRLDTLLDPATSGLRPYRDAASFRSLPAEGVARAEILKLIDELASKERAHWAQGNASGAVYRSDPEHLDFQNEVYARTAQSNPLHTDIWPSSSKFEAEIVSMCARLLGAPPEEALAEAERISGTVTSGGTESIILAMKSYRDLAWSSHRRGRRQILAPESAHAAFDKAAQLLGLEVVRIPVGADYRADLGSMRRAFGPHTLVAVASAPCFPHGVIDPVPEIARLASEQDVGLHVDACLGGFVLPFARELGHAVPDFDFRVPGVTSMSIDTHKYGYAAKGTSVILYRGADLYRQQYFVSTEWSGGLYFSPTLAGSRPGGLSAAWWASLVSTGHAGYLDATRRILETAAQIRRGIAEIPDLYVLGDPLWVIAFASHTVDIYRVLEEMGRRGFSLNGLQHPPSVHLCVTLAHTEPGAAERFLGELRAAVETVRALPKDKQGTAPVYGMATSFPARGAVAELLRRYIERLYRP